jgi:hypothetical protein
VKQSFETAIPDQASGPYGILFAIGGRVSTVRRFEDIINSLDAVDPDTRALLLEGCRHIAPGLSLFVNEPWAKEQTQDGFNWSDAAGRYERVIKRVHAWGVRELEARCYAARAVMFDEYGQDPEAALCVLDDAVAHLGKDIILSRARAKILWRRSDYNGVVSIAQEIADRIGREDPIERAYALREAAISAANTGDMVQSEAWFDEARVAAEASDLSEMRPMAIGLLVDTAVASFRTGARERAMRRMAEALNALSVLDPDQSLRAAYCHRVARHAVLWFNAKIQETDTKLEGKPIDIAPGACSNPEPPEAVRNLPLGALDLALYLLADAEIAAGLDLGIASGLNEKLAEGPIPESESFLRKTWISVSLRRLDPVLFAKHVRSLVEMYAFFRARGSDDGSKFNPLQPARGEIPTLSPSNLSEAVNRAGALDAIFAFCIDAVLRGQATLLEDLEIELVSALGDDFPGSELFKYWRGEAVSLGPLDSIIAHALDRIRGNTHLDPKEIWAVSFRMYEKLRQSAFKNELTPVLAEWSRTQWHRIINSEQFRLYQPSLTIRPIRNVLAVESNTISFIAHLLLSSAEAVNTRLSTECRQDLERVAGIDGTTTTV